jgi:hypothetical protein
MGEVLIAKHFLFLVKHFFTEKNGYFIITCVRIIHELLIDITTRPHTKTILLFGLREQNARRGFGCSVIQIDALQGELSVVFE